MSSSSNPGIINLLKNRWLLLTFLINMVIERFGGQVWKNVWLKLFFKKIKKIKGDYLRWIHFNDFLFLKD